MDKARALGVEVTFRAKGPDAGYAIKIVREVLDTPIETLERQFQQYTGWAAVWAKAQDSVR